MATVIDSKVGRSKNRSTMYVVYKDHKKEPGKSRPIVTGCSGNTRGLSNSVSNLLESVANTIENRFELQRSQQENPGTQEGLARDKKEKNEMQRMPIQD